MAPTYQRYPAAVLALLGSFVATCSAVDTQRHRFLGTVASLDLIDADSNNFIQTITDGATISASGGLSVEAVPSDDSVAKVQFDLDDEFDVRTEGKEPFAMCGDNGNGDFFECRSLGFGTHTITATPFDDDGSAGQATQVTFTLTNGPVNPGPGPSPPPPPPPPPTPVPEQPVPVPVPVPQPVPVPVPVPVPQTSNNGVWIETQGNAPIEERHEACFVMVGNRAYLLGGRGYKDLDIYNPASRQWSKGKEPPIQMHHMQCVAAQGKLWVMAAWTWWYPNERNAEFIYVYDPASDEWSTRTAMPENRRRGGSAVIVSPNERKIYVSHGNDGGHETGNHAVSLGWLDEYDIASDSWKVLSSNAPNPRDHCGGSYVDGKICVAGGRNGGEKNWPEVAPTDCYDLARGRWTQEASIPNPRAGSAYGTTCDGKMIVAGGEGSGKAWKNVDVFDGNKWSSLDDLNVGRHGTGLAVNCACNQIYIASGAASQGGGPEIKSVETYFMGGEDEACRF